MKPFAKLFETDRGQIVAMTEIGDGDRPAIRFYFDPDVEELSICQVALSFPDSDRGEAMAAEALAGMTAERALAAISSTIDDIRAAAAEARAARS